jgi:hypothetical protein
MEVLYRKKINYAQIRILKNYSQIKDKPKKSLDTIFNNSHDIFFMQPKHKNRKTKFFHSDSDKYVRLEFKWASNYIYTNNDEKIKKYYGKPLVFIATNHIEKKVIKNGDKITIKIFKHKKHRDINDIYFKYKTEIYSITFNIKNGNISIFTSKKDNKNQTKIFRTNNFKLINDILLKSDLLKDIVIDCPRINQNLKNSVDEFNDIDNFINIFQDACGIDDKSNKTLLEKIINKFVEIKNIKTPNNANILISHFYPNEKDLKKNNRKIVRAMLDM